MKALGHEDATFTLSIYARAMEDEDGETERLKALVEGRTLDAPRGLWVAAEEAVGGTV